MKTQEVAPSYLANRLRHHNIPMLERPEHLVALLTPPPTVPGELDQLCPKHLW